MTFADIIGHTQQVAYFERVLAQDSAAHAYVFLGPQGVGKMAVAERLAGALLSTELKRLRMHPDVVYVERPLDDKTGDKKKQIPLELIRAACDRLALSAVQGRKIVIIDEADTMTTQAQNALLKTLEEPSGQAVIFLLAEDRSRLLRTIVSRSVPVTLSRVPTVKLAAGLAARGYAPQIAEEAARRAVGRPGVALALADADTLMEAHKRDEVIQQFIAAPRAERIKTIATLVKGDDAKSADGRQQWLLELCDALHLKLHTEPVVPARVVAGLSSLLDARQALQANGNVALALERIALALP
ncbi:MAG: AAA family ATPase [Patescibacteria group bacterium]